jgi:DNA-directed RNA polymerase alpha subunit
MNKASYLNKLYSAAEKIGVAPVAAMFGDGLKFRIPMTQHLWDTSIEELSLTVRSRNGLMRAGTETIGKVAELIMRDDGLNKVRNLGRKSISEIKTALLEEGYKQLDHKARLVFWQDFIDRNNIA